MSWVSWPAVERQAGAEGNETFLGKWIGRDDALKARAWRGVKIGGTKTPVTNVYSDLAVSGRIWVPPSADLLVMRVLISVILNETGAGGPLFVRSRIGSSFGEELRIDVLPYVPPSGFSGQLEPYDLVHDVRGIRDVEDIFTYQLKRTVTLPPDVNGGEIQWRAHWYFAVLA